MSTEDEIQKLLPHHEQKDLCTTRLPYRQGRKLTSVKVYTINNESKHLLIFGVPSLNLRQETKALFMKFGKLLQFNITKYPSEQFTETYHAVYDSIQSARIAKKMLDAKNYYGGNLHICYAPELESIEEAKEKILLRITQVKSRLKNLQREEDMSKQELICKIEEKMIDVGIKNQDANIKSATVEKIYMGATNNIIFGKRKIKEVKTKSVKRVRKEKVNIVNKNIEASDIEDRNTGLSDVDTRNAARLTDVAGPSKVDTPSNLEVIDFTSPNTEVISNINEALNYNKFGDEVIRKVPYKPVNRIKFNFNKMS